MPLSVDRMGTFTADVSRFMQTFQISIKPITSNVPIGILLFKQSTTMPHCSALTEIL